MDLADKRLVSGAAGRRPLQKMRKKTPKLTIRIDLGGGRALGPGKIRLLEAIDETGSISEAGRELNISYSRAWQMVDDLKGCFRSAVIKPRQIGNRNFDADQPGILEHNEALR